MFKVRKFDVCRATGITSFAISWDLLDGHGEQNHEGAFLTRSDAEKHIISSKRSYIRLLFEKYVFHAKVLIESGNPDYYRTPGKIDSLDRLIKYCHWFQDKNLEGICRVLANPDIESHLRKLLPTPLNSSFHSSEQRVLDMMVFVKKELENYPTQPLKISRHEERV